MCIRVLELTYTAWDLTPFARDCGYDGPPFRWDEERRFLLRCELDAAYFHLYGIARDDVDYIMETFPIVREKDIRRHGDYRTKLVILHCYDAMQRAIDTGEPYQTLLDPPPADPRVAHPDRGARPAWLDGAPPPPATRAAAPPAAAAAPGVARTGGPARRASAAPDPPRPAPSGRIVLAAPITVRALAERLATSPIAVIKALMSLEILATIDQELDVEVAKRVAEGMGYSVKREA